jgi:hypothetical protein
VNNVSGQTLKLGDEGWVKFFVESADNFIVQKLSDPSVAGEFSVDSAMTATRRVNLAPYFNLQRPGRYRVTARVNVPQWGVEITSDAKSFDIVPGTKLQVLEFGAPQQKENEPPAVHKYILQQAQLGKELQLYLRVTDESESIVFKVFPVARMLSFSKPEAQLDRFNNIHILHQVGQKSFSYCVVNSDGQIITRQMHDYRGDSRPRLRTVGDGRVEVSGGRRNYSETDLPPSLDLSIRAAESEKPKETKKESNPASP